MGAPQYGTLHDPATLEQQQRPHTLLVSARKRTFVFLSATKPDEA